MTRLSWIAFLCAGALPVALLAPATGCSSSNTASPVATDGGSDAGTSVDGGGGDGGAETTSLTWGTTLYASLLTTTDDGGAAATDAGSAGDASDAGTTTDASASADGGSPDAGSADAEAPDANASANVADANAGDAGAVTDAESPSDDDGSASVVPGVQVCAYLASAIDGGTVPTASSALDCVTTAADGTFVLPSLPVRTNVVLTLTKAGFTPVVLSIGTASTPMDARSNPITMFSTSYQVDPVPGVSVDWQNKGQLYMFVIGPAPDGGNNFSGAPGATVSITPVSGNGPLYQDTSGRFVPDASAFVENLGGFFNLTPGVVTLTFADPNLNCQPITSSPASLWGFPLTTPPRSLQALILPGYISGLVGEFCTPIPPIVAVDGG